MIFSFIAVFLQPLAWVLVFREEYSFLFLQVVLISFC